METVTIAFGHEEWEQWPFPVLVPYDASKYARTVDAQSPRAQVAGEEWEAYQRHVRAAEAWQRRWAFLAYGNEVTA